MSTRLRTTVPRRGRQAPLLAISGEGILNVVARAFGMEQKRKTRAHTVDLTAMIIQRLQAYMEFQSVPWEEVMSWVGLLDEIEKNRSLGLSEYRE